MAKELKFYNPKFEQVVRHKLLISDRAITDEDALNVFDLDCYEFNFDSRDYEALSAFENLEYLTINTRANELDFLKKLPLLEVLNLETWTENKVVDFNHFSHLIHLRELFVSGGAVSSIDYKNLDGLAKLKKLEHLTLHEFGSVDLRSLRSMPWLKGLYCGYANEVYDIEAIATLSNLQELTLIDVEMDNLHFLDSFPDSLMITLCGLRVKEEIDYSKIYRFAEGEFDDMEDLWWKERYGIREESNLEIERKYVIEKPQIDKMRECGAYTSSEIVQIYLDSEAGVTRRVRSRAYSDGRVQYFETEKERVDEMSSIERECEITKAEFDNFSLQIAAKTRPITKTRHTFDYLGQTFEIDVYPEWECTCIMETELPSRDTEVKMPSFIRIIAEVTGDKRYSNAAMSRSFPEELK